MLEKQTRPYEIFVRFDADGVAHAHFGEVERVVDTDTGETVGSERELPVRPVSVEAAAAVIGEQSAVMLAQIAQLTAALTSEKDRADRAEADRDAALTQVAAVAAPAAESEG